MNRKIRLAAAGVLAFAALVLPAAAARAATQNFTPAGGVVTGMLVSAAKAAQTVEPATTANASLLVGVAVVDNTALDIQPGQVAVRTDGAAPVMVSTLGGDIKAGDRIGVSAVKGVGGKLDSSGWTVGIAQADFNARTPGAVASDVTDDRGGKHRVYVGTLPITVKVSYYSTSNLAAVDNIFHRKIDILTLAIAGFLMLSGIIVAGLIGATAVRSGLTSIARQPLIKQSIMPQIFQSLGLSLVILIASGVAAYTVLRFL